MKHSFKVADICYIAVFTALTAVCSWITVGAAVPFTLQLFAVFFSLEMLGGKRGTVSIIAYILIGITGIPVFSGFTGGIGRIFSPSGGFIVGFAIIGLIYLFLTEFFGESLSIRISSLIIGLFICYAFGIIWFMFITGNSFISSFTVCVLPFIIPDAAKLALAVFLANRISAKIKL